MKNKLKFVVLCGLLLAWLPQQLNAVPLAGLYTISNVRKTEQRYGGGSMFDKKYWAVRHIDSFVGGSRVFVDSHTDQFNTNVWQVNQVVYRGSGYQNTMGTWNIHPQAGFEISPQPRGSTNQTWTNVVDVSSYPNYYWTEEAMQVGHREWKQGDTRTTVDASISFLIYNLHNTNTAYRMKFYCDSDQGEFIIENRDTQVGAGENKVFTPTIAMARQASGRPVKWFYSYFWVSNAAWQDTPPVPLPPQP